MLRPSGLLAAVLAAVPALIAQAPTQPATREKIIRFVRERFTIPDTVKITMTDLRESIYPDFLETTVTLDDGKEKRTQALFVSGTCAIWWKAASSILAATRARTLCG